MECFNSLLLKLREVHEREVEAWQVKIQELSNKKGCDTKRMEELFTKNQQMKEQHRVLTENIKTLENRLRAGLCDRCTVTQEVAKRRQQEFEASQIQSLQHISLLAGEMNNLTKENKRLRDEIKVLRTSFQGPSEHSSSTAEGKRITSPNLSPSSGPVAFMTTATSRASTQPADGDVVMKSEADQKTEETEHRQWRGMKRNHFDSYKPLSTLASPSWKTEPCASRVGEKRAQNVVGLDQHSSIPPQALILKNSSSSSASGEGNPSRHVLHAPVPCRPQPIKSSPVTLPWSAGTSLLMQPSPKPNLPRFPNLVPAGQHGSPRRQSFGSLWHKQSPTEPTVLFRLRSLSEHLEGQSKSHEKTESPPPKAERVSGEGLREVNEAPLDLSDPGKSKSSQSPRDYSRVENGPEKDVKTIPSPHGPVLSPNGLNPASSSSTPSVKQQAEEPASDQKHQQEQREEVNGKADQSSEKKVPVLTISLRPVVVLETLNSPLQKQDSFSANSQSSSPAVEAEGRMGEQDEEDRVSGHESSPGCKRKRASVESETDRDSDTENIQQERKIKITVRAEEKSPSLSVTSH